MVRSPRAGGLPVVAQQRRELGPGHGGAGAQVDVAAPFLVVDPLASFISVVAGVVLTWLLCRTVKTGFFEPAEPQPGPATTTPTAGLEPPADGAVTKLRQLAQLRDAGVITDAEFQAKKDDLLTQI